MNSELQRVQRTLIVTQGELAQHAGDRFRRLLADRRGPEEALAVVTAGEEKDRLAPAVQAALTQISPATLGATLIQRGWQLEGAQEIHLILLLDLVAGRDAADLCQRVTGMVRAHLRVEPVAMLVWVAGSEEPGTEENAGALVIEDQARHFPRGVIALSRLNEAGLRLRSDAALGAVAAELLWTLIATPLRQIPEQSTIAYNPKENGALMTASVAGWRWSPDATLAYCHNRWLGDVFKAWLADEATPVTMEEATTWLDQNELTAAALADQALSPEDREMPEFPTAVWRAPPPWRMHALLQQLRTSDEIDRAGQREREERAGLHMEQPLRQGGEAMASYLESLLDARPVGGVAKAESWTTTVRQALQEAFVDLGAQEAKRVKQDVALSEERGLMQAQLRDLLDDWPGPGWRGWMRIIWRGWRWPHLLWRYWKLRRLGQQLTFILRQQAIRRRQKAATAAAGGALLELAELARHWHGHVEEIGDMLRHVQRENDGEEEYNENEDEVVAALFLLPPHVTGETVYSQIAPDTAAEAEAAAAATGGLGQHLRALDDAALEPLQSWGKARLEERLEPYTAVSVVADRETPPTLQTCWQYAWETAAPLWRYEEACLPEAQRTNSHSQSFLCGAELAELREQIAPLAPHALHWVSTPERERILLLRLRGGLTVEAMTR